MPFILINFFMLSSFDKLKKKKFFFYHLTNNAYYLLSFYLRFLKKT